MSAPVMPATTRRTLHYYWQVTRAHFGLFAGLVASTLAYVALLSYANPYLMSMVVDQVSANPVAADEVFSTFGPFALALVAAAAFATVAFVRHNQRPAQEGESEALPKDKEYISVKADYKVSLVKISDIVYLESEGEYVRMHLADGTTITTLFRLKNMETALPSESFMRVHRSYIVNLRTIKAYVKGRIFLNDTEYVPIGENYKEAFQGYIDKNFRNL